MGTKKEEPQFEEALSKLEQLVGSMESGEIRLDALVEKFEEGSRLVKACEERLRQAELKVEKLRADNATFALEPFGSGKS